MELGFDVSRALLWIVLLPLAGAVLNGFVGRYASRQAVSAVGVGTVAGAFVLSVLCFAALLGAEGEQPRLVYEFYEWFSITLGNSEVPVNVWFTMDPLSGVMALIVTGVGLLIHVYATGYMHDDPGYARFFAYLNLFMASMLILVLASNLPLMFVGWEGVGLCSYLLIGYWWENTDYAKAGRKAFVANRIGDFGVLIGMFVLVGAVGSFEFDAINAAAPGLRQPFTLGAFELGTVATVACLFLFLGCTGKSAQIPLYVWLPDAMAGPTPVSALIHAATMVTAGVYLCCRLSHVFFASPTAMAVVAIVGALTALLAASIALAQNEMKKVLAYSTVSQLGFMFAAVGVGAFAAGIFHVYTHAFFKACLFLGAGSVMHAVGAHGDADIRRLGGLRKVLPTTHWTFAASTAAIAGFPLLSGFFSKDEILLGAATLGGGQLAGTPMFGYADVQWVGWLVFGILAAAAVMTAFYMFRLYFLTFWGEYRSASADGEHGDHHAYDAHPHESPPSMAVPLMVLGAGAIAAGWLNLEPLAFLGIHFNAWGDWLAGSLAAVQVEAPAAHTIAGVSGLLAFLAGSGLAYARYVQRKVVPPDRLAEGAPVLQRLALDKWRVDELYQAVIIRPIQQLALLAGRLDKYFVDMLLTKVTAMAVRLGGWLVTRVQTGLVFAYGAVLVIGLGAAVWWFLYPHAVVEAEVDGADATLRAERGLGYDFRWDLGADGTFETDWSPDPELTHTFGPAELRGPVLLVEPPPRQRVGPDEARQIELDDGEAYVLPDSLLGRRWDARTEDAVAPVVRREGERLVVRGNDARVRFPGRGLGEDEVTLEYGDVAFVAGATVQVGAEVEVAVQVRNAFGNVVTRSYELVVQPEPAARGPRAALEVQR
ncbi:MAG: NADH-quinone oxidoreductase subunit L [Myxococcota bacterium]